MNKGWKGFPPYQMTTACVQTLPWIVCLELVTDHLCALYSGSVRASTRCRRPHPRHDGPTPADERRAHDEAAACHWAAHGWTTPWIPPTRYAFHPNMPQFSVISTQFLQFSILTHKPSCTYLHEYHIPLLTSPHTLNNTLTVLQLARLYRRSD